MCWNYFYFFPIRILAEVSKVRRSPARLSCSASFPASLVKMTSRLRPRRLWRSWPRVRPITRMSSPRQTPCWPLSRPRSRQPRLSGGWNWRPPTSEFIDWFVFYCPLRLNNAGSVLNLSVWSFAHGLCFSESLVIWESRSLRPNHISAQTRYR